jgi:predicted RNA-binding Zn ribbon-like protein
MPETVSFLHTAASIRLDGGHPVLDLVNTQYGAPEGPIDGDVLATPEDVLILARRLGMAADGDTQQATPATLRQARALRRTVDGALRPIALGAQPDPGALRELERIAKRAVSRGRLCPAGPQDRGVGWTWSDDDPLAPVDRLAVAAVALLADHETLTRLRRCAGCRWLFVDRSRGAGRRWCSMADCGTEAKQRRFIEQRRQRRAAVSG